MITITEAAALPTPDEVYERIRPHLDPSHDRDRVLEALRAVLTCQVEGHGAFTSFCARCRGAAGGSRKTPAKKKALRQSIKKARRRRWTA